MAFHHGPRHPGASAVHILLAVRLQRRAHGVAALQGAERGDAMGEVHRGQGAQATEQLLRPWVDMAMVGAMVEGHWSPWWMVGELLVGR